MFYDAGVIVTVGVVVPAAEAVTVDVKVTLLPLPAWIVTVEPLTVDVPDTVTVIVENDRTPAVVSETLNPDEVLIIDAALPLFWMVMLNVVVCPTVNAESPVNDTDKPSLAIVGVPPSKDAAEITSLDDGVGFTVTDPRLAVIGEDTAQTVSIVAQKTIKAIVANFTFLVLNNFGNFI